MSAEITPQKTEVVFKRENKIVRVSMYCDPAGCTFGHRIWRKGNSLFFDTREIKGNLYDLINEEIKSHFSNLSNCTRDSKLLNLEKPEGDLLNIVKDVFCKGEPLSLLVEYECHSLEESLFDCKDCG